jgi:MoxR-like ATPase
MTDQRPLDPALLASARAHCDALLREIAKVYIGSPTTTELLLVALLARGHVLLEGVPGIAKTTLVKTFARTLGCRFRRIQFTPDLLPSDITGTFILDQKKNDFELRRGPIFANIVLGDEINRAPAKTQSALLEAMQECQVTIEGTTLALEAPFMVLATQNPIEEEGVYLLPEAQVDRFLFKLVLDYPSADDEQRFLRTYNAPLPDVAQVLGPETILALGAAAEQVHIEAELIDYIVRLVRYTRSHPRVLLGVSPRGALMLMRAAKVRALLHGRPFVLPDDVRLIAPNVVTHRIVLTAEAELEGQRPSGIAAEALERVPYSVR